MRRFILAVVLALNVLPLLANAAPPRKWTDATGKFSVEAELVEIKDGAVHLKKADGEIITVPVNKLSEADRGFLANRTATKPAAKPPADPPTSTASTQPGLMNRADADGDGKIIRAEWSKFAQGFRQFDTDNNDALEAAELEALGDAELLLSIADSNNDKKIIRAEWAQLAQGFARLDTGKDGAITQAELQAAADSALAKSSGSTSLAGGGDAPKVETGPTVWRGRIEGRGLIELVVNGNQIAGREIGPGGQPGEGLGAGTFTMTGDGKLGNMDAVYTEGRNRGEVCLGIYQLEGDTLRWCVSNRSGNRPQDFSGGRGNWLMVLTKVPAQ